MTVHRIPASSPYLTVRLAGHPVECVGLIDTGASMTAVHPRIIESARPPEIGLVDMGRAGDDPGRRNVVPTYYFRMSFGGSSAPVGVEVVAAVPSSPCQVLIGRDVIARWIMTLDGPEDRLVIAI